MKLRLKLQKNTYPQVNQHVCNFKKHHFHHLLCLGLSTDFNNRTFKSLEALFGTNTFNFIDVGGLKSERRKWIHSFQNTGVVIFFINISEFDQTTLGHVNKLQESKLILESAMALFKLCSFIIFLNKLDLFEVL